jgi:arylsulfatase A-like enzyme
VIDIAATVLDAAGLPAPTHVHSVEQMPLHGVTLVPTFDDAAAPERRETQCFEMFCNRGIYHDGWTAVTRHTPSEVTSDMPAFEDDVWELYGPDDWSQAHDLSAEQPEKLALSHHRRASAGERSGFGGDASAACVGPPSGGSGRSWFVLPPPAENGATSMQMASDVAIIRSR